MRHAHAPYSKVRVGAAVIAREGPRGGTKVFTGSNIENASFGATVCAERVAVWNAVSQGYNHIDAVAIATQASPPWSPCGLCRQVLAEFGDETMAIHLTNPKGEIRSTTLGKLFPVSFSRRQLDKA